MVISENKKNNTVLISIAGDLSNVHLMKNALIDLVQNYNPADDMALNKETVYYAMELIRTLQPDETQYSSILDPQKDVLELPENIEPLQKQLISEALFMIKYPDTKIRSTKNPVYEALKMEV